MSEKAINTQRKTLKTLQKACRTIAQDQIWLIIIFCIYLSRVHNVKFKYFLLFSFYSECTQTSCNPPAAETDPNLLNDFKRSIIWDISVPERTVVALDFPGAGLKDIGAGGECPDGFKYSVRTTESDGAIKSKSYCKGGTASPLNVFRATTVTVEVPKGEKLESAAFNVKAAQRGKSEHFLLLIIHFTERKQPSKHTFMETSPTMIVTPSN